MAGSPPVSRLDWPLTVDPRKWDEFTRHTLVGGDLTPDKDVNKHTTKSPKDTYKREPSQFDHWVYPPGTSKVEMVAEPGRYHLFVAGVCPWASGTRATLATLQLEGVIGMDIADGQSSKGWVYLSGVTCKSFPDRKPFFLHEVYTASEAECTTRITVPVLWDTKLNKVVSNDSWAIMKMLAVSFRPLSPSGGESRDLYPLPLAEAIETEHKALYQALLNNVYRAGITLTYKNVAGHAAASEEVYETLAALDTKLQHEPFLINKQFTLLDIRVAMTVLRYDAAYYDAFALRGAGHILTDGQSAFPAVRDWVRAVYTIVRTTVDWPSFSQYFRWTVGHDSAAPLPDLAVIKADVEKVPTQHRTGALLIHHL